MEEGDEAASYHTEGEKKRRRTKTESLSLSLSASSSLPSEGSGGGGGLVASFLASRWQQRGEGGEGDGGKARPFGPSTEEKAGRGEASVSCQLGSAGACATTTVENGSPPSCL